MHKLSRFEIHFNTLLTKEIRTAKFWTEVCVISERFMNKLNYMSPLVAIVISQQKCIITSTVICSKFFFAPLLLLDGLYKCCEAMETTLYHQCLCWVYEYEGASFTNIFDLQYLCVLSHEYFTLLSSSLKLLKGTKMKWFYHVGVFWLDRQCNRGEAT